jgi:hypothetical protein
MSGGVKRKPDTGGGPVDDRWKKRIDKKDKQGV